MQRRQFFKNGSLTLLASTLTGGSKLWANESTATARRTKNIIFMVSDGMSTGTLNMANLFKYRKEGKQSQWLSLYEEQKVVRALMDTASANSLITDSAAGSSSWGGGVRVNNGSLNVGPDGISHTPILQKFKASGKSVGCVTTVPITHATPAGFCITNNKRGDQFEIALQYFPLRFDVMMGGGLEYFSQEKRPDKQDLFASYRQKGYEVVLSRGEMSQVKPGKPLLGVFHEDGLPYALDRSQDAGLQERVPTLAEMTGKAIELMSRNKNGFMLQVEGGKVDWAAHANDVSALIYEQLDFDEAVKEAIAFAEEDRETLVIITTDHGNANPGLFYGATANKNFDHIQQFKHTNDWILNGINKNFSAAQVIERVEYAQGMVLKQNEAETLLGYYSSMDETGLYNPRKLPFRYLAELQTGFTSVGWGSMDHSADYVELAAYGPGSELLKPFVKNTDLHYLMLQVTGVNYKEV